MKEIVAAFIKTYPAAQPASKTIFSLWYCLISRFARLADVK